MKRLDLSNIMNEHLLHQSIIITLDIDPFLFDKLSQISQMNYTAVEINTTDIALFSAIREKYPKLRMGAGNILNTEELELCYEAKVDFVTSPGLLPELVQTAAVYRMHYLPGIATMSEAMALLKLGGQQARPYPASLSFCTLLNKNFPTLRLFPAEIEWEETEHYLSIPSVDAVHLLNPSIKHLQTLSQSILAEL